jgi:hypothetical protein
VSITIRRQAGRIHRGLLQVQSTGELRNILIHGLSPYPGRLPEELVTTTTLNLLTPEVPPDRHNQVHPRMVHITVHQQAGLRLILSRPEKTGLPPVPGVTLIRVHILHLQGHRQIIHTIGHRPVRGVVVAPTQGLQAPEVRRIIQGPAVLALQGVVPEVRAFHVPATPATPVPRAQAAPAFLVQAAQEVRVRRAHRVVRVLHIPAVQALPDHPVRDDKLVYV